MWELHITIEVPLIYVINKGVFWAASTTQINSASELDLLLTTSTIALHPDYHGIEFCGLHSIAK